MQDTRFSPLCLALHSLGFKVKEIPSIQQASDDFSCLLMYFVPYKDYTFIINNRISWLKKKAILLIWEPEFHERFMYDKDFHDYFDIIFTQDDTLVDEKKYFRIFCPQNKLSMSTKSLPFKQKKLSVLISSFFKTSYPYSLYAERLSVALFYENTSSDLFDLYGHKGWSEQGLKNYCGSIDNKQELLEKYKFCYCYENSCDTPGYITEKIFDCFCAGCVPIYWGASNIENYIPQKCFIDRRKFKTTQDVNEFIQSISEKQYNDYLSAIDNYLTKHPMAQKFSIDNHVNIILKGLNLLLKQK